MLPEEESSLCHQSSSVVINSQYQRIRSTPAFDKGRELRMCNMQTIFSDSLRGLVSRKFTEACARKDVIFSETQLAVLQNSFKTPVHSSSVNILLYALDMLTTTDTTQILSCTSQEADKGQLNGEQGRFEEKAI